MTHKTFSFDGYSTQHKCVFSIQMGIDPDNLSNRVLYEIVAYDKKNGHGFDIKDVLGTKLELVIGHPYKQIMTLEIPADLSDIENSTIIIEPMVDDRVIEMRDIRTGLIFDIALDNKGKDRYCLMPISEANKKNPNFPYEWNEKEKAWYFKSDQKNFFVNQHFEGFDPLTGALYQIEYGGTGKKHAPEVNKISDPEAMKDIIPTDSDVLAVSQEEDLSKELELLIEETRAMPAMSGKMHIIDSIVATIRNRRADIILNGTAGRENSIHSLLGSVDQDFGHMAFLGNPGTLKTVFAKIYHLALRAEGFLKGPMVVVNGEEVMQGYVGKSNEYMRGKIEEALNSNGMLFVDEFHSLNDGGGSQKSSQFGMKAARELIATMENNRDKFVVILAGYPEEMTEAIKAIDPGLKDRLSEIYVFDDYDADELEDVFHYLLPDNYILGKGAEALIRDKIEKACASKDKTFSNGRLMRKFVASAIKAQTQRVATVNLELIERDRAGTLTHQFKTAARRKKLTITVDDIMNVDLSTIDKKEQANTIGFGRPLSSEAKQPANKNDRGADLAAPRKPAPRDKRLKAV